MSEVANAAAVPSAGRLLREARERQGLHIAALAAAIKVAPKKLELLEADRFGDLPDATFARALAQTVCRALKVDPGEVLQLLPPPAGHRLEHVSQGLNAPFRDRPGVAGQREPTGSALGPVFWVTTLILVAAVVVYFLPVGWLSLAGWRSAAERRDGAASAVTVVPSPLSVGGVAAPGGGDGPPSSSSATATEPLPPGAEPIPRGADPTPSGTEPIPPGAEPIPRGEAATSSLAAPLPSASGGSGPRSTTP